MSSFAKDIFSVMKSRVTIIASGIITGIITARYIGPVGNGVIATLSVYPDLFMTIGSLGIRQSTTYFIGQKKYADEDIFASVMYVWLFTTFFCMLVCAALLKFFTKADYSTYLIFLAVIPIPFSLFVTYASGFFLGKNNIKDFNTVNWVPNVMRLVGSCLLIIIIPLGVQGAMIGIFVGYFFLSFLVYARLKKMVKIKLNFNKVIIKDLLNLGVVYALSYLIISLNYKLDVTLLERCSTQYEVGIYTKGVSVVNYLWEVPTILSTIIFSRSATSKDPKDFSYKVCMLLRLCNIIILILSIGFFFTSKFVMVSMYGEKFAASAMAQKLLIPGILILTVFKVLNMDLAGKGKPWVAMKAMVPGLIINIIMNYVLDGKYGANGASISSTISYTVAAGVFLFMYSKEVSIPIKEVLTYKRADFDVIIELFSKYRKKLVS